jgi:hypothetical protein
MNHQMKLFLLPAVIALLSPSAAATQPISVHANFEGAALGRLERVSKTHFRCGVKGESDQAGRNRQANWYYFRVDGAKGQALTIDLIDLPGEYNYRPNRGAVTGDTLPWYSADNQQWRQIETAEYQAATPLLRIRLTPRANKIWIAHIPPYTNQHLQRLLGQFKTHPALHQQVAGRTVQGRKILLLTITDERAPAEQKKVIWLMFRQHSWEAGSSWAGEGALRFLLSADPNDRQLPAFLIEQMITRHPKLGRQPTPEDRQQFGADLARAMWRTVMQ